MVRFKLRTSFLTHARDQIRAGVWYKVLLIDLFAAGSCRRSWARGMWPNAGLD